MYITAQCQMGLSDSCYCVWQDIRTMRRAFVNKSQDVIMVASFVPKRRWTRPNAREAIRYVSSDWEMPNKLLYQLFRAERLVAANAMLAISCSRLRLHGEADAC